MIGAALIGAATQLLAGLMNIGSFPAAFVGAVGAVTGARALHRDLDGAALRFGVAVVAACVSLVFGLLSRVPVYAVTVVLSASVLGWALVRTRRLAEESHASWSLAHRVRERELTELREQAERRGRDRDAQAEEASARATDDTWWQDL